METESYQTALTNDVRAILKQGIKVEDGRLLITPQVASWLYVSIVDSFIACGGINVVQATVQALDGEDYHLTIQRAGGKTALTLMDEANIRADEALAALADAHQEIARLKTEISNLSYQIHPA